MMRPALRSTTTMNWVEFVYFCNLQQISLENLPLVVAGLMAAGFSKPPRLGRMISQIVNFKMLIIAK